MGVEILVGKTLQSVENRENKELVFVVSENEIYKLYHEQDCCESVTIEDIIGDLSDLVGSPILMSKEIDRGSGGGDHGNDTFTWTFYKFATLKGYVTVRWYGSSNGYHSESVYFSKVK